MVSQLVPFTLDIDKTIKTFGSGGNKQGMLKTEVLL
jgi:hypothetical protein